MDLTRREFLARSALAAGAASLLPSLSLAAVSAGEAQKVMTVSGLMNAHQMGTTLPHEHVLVDFIGAAAITPDRYSQDEAFRRMLPFLQELRELGCQTLVECTPAYLGRDPQLLKRLSSETGLHLMTNTGYYGAANNKYLPGHAFEETADQLARRWIDEWRNGIGKSGVRPGFMKIGVGGASLSELHQKLVRAAARAHLETGLAIASHTGPSKLAHEQLNLLREEGVASRAFIWVHAQNERDLDKVMEVAGEGCWVSFDGYSERDTQRYVEVFNRFKTAGKLNQLLLSHDAGWFRPGEPNGGEIRPFTALFKTLIPALKETATELEINQVLRLNPSRAFTIGLARSR